MKAWGEGTTDEPVEVRNIDGRVFATRDVERCVVSLCFLALRRLMLGRRKKG